MPDKAATTVSVKVFPDSCVQCAFDEGENLRVQSFRPRDKRCFTASSLNSSAVATVSMD